MTRAELHLRVKAGRLDELLAVLGRIDLITAATGQPGFLAAEVQLQLDDEQHVLVTSSWASTDHFERWLASPAWPDLVGQIRGLVSGKPDIRAYRVVDVVEATP